MIFIEPKQGKDSSNSNPVDKNLGYTTSLFGMKKLLLQEVIKNENWNYRSAASRKNNRI